MLSSYTPLRYLFSVLCIAVCTPFAMLHAQNVGISESAPASKLSVKGSATVGSSYSTTAAPADGILVQGTAGFGTTAPASQVHVHGGNFQLTNSTTGALTTDGFKITPGSSVTLNNLENGDLLFSTYNAEKMRAQANGNVVVNKTAADVEDIFSAYAADYSGAINTTGGKYALNAYANSRSALYAENNASGLVGSTPGTTTINYTAYFWNKGAASASGIPPTRTMSVKLGSVNSVVDASSFGITSTGLYVQNDYTNTDLAIWAAGYGKGVNGSAILGTNYNGTTGTDFSAGARVGITGQAYSLTGTSINYAFGIYGFSDIGSFSTRTGGVLGLASLSSSTSISSGGSLGYWASSGTGYSIYGFGKSATTGSSGGRMAASAGSTENAHIGIGVTGGVMGGWIHGGIYGTFLKGERFGAYIDGANISNQPTVQLVTIDDASPRIATYASVATTPDITARGRARLSNGRAEIAFNSSFQKIVGADVVVTVTPLGDCNGLHLTRLAEGGFEVAENQSGTTNTEFTWIAVGSIKSRAETTVSSEILASDFDTQMRGVTTPDADTNQPTPVWWDGSNIRFDTIPTGTFPRNTSTDLRQTPVRMMKEEKGGK